jgi:hypothetical protein
MAYNNDDDLGVLEPPRHDMLMVRFMGDPHELVLPYCEVANGDLISIKDSQIKISVVRDDTTESVEMAYSKFVELIEKTFDTKGITKLSAQLAGSYDIVKIL